MVIDGLHDMARRLCDGIINCAVSGVATLIVHGIGMNGCGDMVLLHGSDYRLACLGPGGADVGRGIGMNCDCDMGVGHGNGGKLLCPGLRRH